jgi:hypothetical protein
MCTQSTQNTQLIWLLLLYIESLCLQVEFGVLEGFEVSPKEGLLDPGEVVDVKVLLLGDYCLILKKIVITLIKSGVVRTFFQGTSL